MGLLEEIDQTLRLFVEVARWPHVLRANAKDELGVVVEEGESDGLGDRAEGVEDARSGEVTVL